MKQYLVFAGDNYYPSGGWRDFVESFDSLDEALLFISIKNFDWWQIVSNNSLIKSGHR